jgi:ApeA N-terminal domain 1
VVGASADSFADAAPVLAGVSRTSFVVETGQSRHSELMDYFALDGSWWLPGSPDHRVSGTLTFSADGLTLVVYGSLVPTVRIPDAVLEQTTPDWEETAVILGNSHAGKKVTLLGASGANLIGPHVTQSHYRVRLALTDVEVTVDAFTEIQFEFDCLTAWTEPPSISEPLDDSRRQFRLRFETAELGIAHVADAPVELIATVVGSIGGNTAYAKQEAAFRVRLPSTSSRDIINHWVRPLQDLLVLALGRAVRLTGLYMKPEGAAPNELFGRASFEAVQPPAGPTPDWSAIMSYTAPTLLTFRNSPVPFAELIPRWFRLRQELNEVLVLLHGEHYATFMFNEHKYSAVFQSAEALAHARGLSGREKTRQEHRARIIGIVAAARAAGIDEETVGWAERILTARNDKPLAQQIHDLVASTGEIGKRVLDASPDFGRITASARTGVSHGRAQKAMDASGRFWHGDALRWIVRSRVLMDLGLDLAEVEHRVLSCGGFSHTVEEIQKYAEHLRSEAS